ncbi:MAG: HAD family phosphatase [Erysipelotrichaceae bacterium]|nr:HAD family phosphatase [Erysipelotrichaceae bacterium]
MKKKILFFDVDGTLVGKDKILSPLTKYALNELRKNGHLSFLCTGRSKNYITHLLSLPFDGYISNAGACVVLRGKTIYSRYLNPLLIRKIEDVFDRCGIAYDHECDDYDYIKEKMISDLFRDDDPDIQKEKIARYLKENSTLPMKEYNGQPVYKISYTCDDHKQIRQAAEELKDDVSIMVNPAFSKIAGDLLYEGVNKGEAIKQLISYLNLSMEDTIAFGDSMNDAEMLKTCEIAVVMGNGDEKTKKYADIVCESVEDDGVYQELIRLGLIDPEVPL